MLDKALVLIVVVVVIAMDILSLIYSSMDTLLVLLLRWLKVIIAAFEYYIYIILSYEVPLTYLPVF